MVGEKLLFLMTGLLVNRFRVGKKSCEDNSIKFLIFRLQIFPRRDNRRSGGSVIEPATAERRGYGSVPGDTTAQPQGNLSSFTNTYVYIVNIFFYTIGKTSTTSIV